MCLFQLLQVKVFTVHVGVVLEAECTKVEDASSFEVAIIDENLPDGEQEWDVKGWQSREDINALLSNY